MPFFRVQRLADMSSNALFSWLWIYESRVALATMSGCDRNYFFTESSWFRLNVIRCSVRCQSFTWVYCKMAMTRRWSMLSSVHSVKCAKGLPRCTQSSVVTHRRIRGYRQTAHVPPRQQRVFFWWVENIASSFWKGDLKPQRKRQGTSVKWCHTSSTTNFFTEDDDT